MQDIAYFMLASPTIPMRRQHELELIDLYRNSLLEFGVAQPGSHELLFDAYRFHALHSMAVSTIVAGLLDGAGERGTSLAQENIRRGFTAVADLHSASLLPA